MAGNTVFVTVGTTEFSPLIRKITEPDHLQALKLKGYAYVILQIGKDLEEPPMGAHDGVNVDFYRFKDSLAEDIRNADLVISHAGAGSCLEVLEEGKPLIVVVNQQLMNNHQEELATALQSRGYAVACNTDTLLSAITSLDVTTINPYPKADPNVFMSFLNQVMGAR